MLDFSKIEWTHYTANFWWGCMKVHAGCDHCYAEYFANHRYLHNIWGADRPRKFIKTFLGKMDKYQHQAAQANEIHRVFIGSMKDIFEKPVQVVSFKGEPMYHTDGNLLDTGHLRNQLFDRISEGRYPNLSLLLLTKRPSNINKMIPSLWKTNPPKNLMYGTSPCDQPTYDNLTKHLLDVNGKRFLSVEPQIDMIKLKRIKGIDWIIQGGESGSERRFFDLPWARSMRDECQELGIPYFFKQINKIDSIPEDLLVRQFPLLETV